LLSFFTYFDAFANLVCVNQHVACSL